MSVNEELALREDDAPPAPWPLFQRWYQAVQDAQVPEPAAMTLATASADGTPSARVVLLRGHGERGFDFYTNYDSRKGHELAENPRAALVFYWPLFARQVRVEGSVERLSAADSDRYFQQRPFGHRLGALVSPQSQVIPARQFLEERLGTLHARYSPGDEVPRPEHWGGFRVIPVQIEFWQGRENRLHDRLRYRRSGADQPWHIERLAP